MSANHEVSSTHTLYQPSFCQIRYLVPTFYLFRYLRQLLDVTSFLYTEKGLYRQEPFFRVDSKMDYIAIVAAICSTSASIPQLLKSSEKLSTVSMSLRGVGGVGWSIYGILRGEWALAISSAVVVGIECALCFKQHRGEEQEVQNDTEQIPVAVVSAVFA